MRRMRQRNRNQYRFSGDVHIPFRQHLTLLAYSVIFLYIFHYTASNSPGQLVRRSFLIIVKKK
ncbi:hypothetical protein AYR54_02130 [Loigolactobacillus backii]|nr:hypothetical protein AYR52_02135 [Loigolactobacillus backii]ANK64161.1 hypothetical protein AYR54_02130 [Loigolactobacillus backii]ANK67444.1 hypothetical protein AYR55_06905 [Loigolactobacillus backii]